MQTSFTFYRFYSIFCITLVGGNKEKLRRRLILKQKESKNLPSLSERKSNFVGKTNSAPIGTKPQITQHYKETFSAIDRFSQRLGYINYPHKVNKTPMKILISVLMMGSVNTWTIHQEANSDHVNNNFEQDYKMFMKCLFDSLVE